ncbi:MAG TPA: di-heme-cytochrome C peroxidase [Thermoanaerobaculia bacterium]|nr:di-heme-cytochrome C peroxidase [Thermoanaerobaculia bacterium]
MSKRRLRWAVASVVTLLTLTLVNCSALEPRIREGEGVPGTVGRVVNLAQGWSEEQQQLFWFTSQGSRIIPMDWFLVLEQASSTDLFRSNSHMERLGFLLEEPGPANPNGLPVGFAQDTDRATGQAFMGWTCAACHTNQIHYQGTALRIDGAPTLADVWSFLTELEAALRETATDRARFRRFAEKVLGTDPDPNQVEGLHRDLLAATMKLSARLRGDAPPHPYGYGRVDAFGIIFNQLLGANLDLPGNDLPADAPVSYPFLWDTPYSDVVQWNGAISNRGIGPLARNVGEALGVFAVLSVDPARRDRGYESSVQIENLGKIEEALKSLQSPLWPSEFLPAIDPVLAAQGKEIYRMECASCHSLIDRTSSHRQFSAVMIPITEVRTDDAMADNFVRRVAVRTGRLQGSKVDIVAGDTFGPIATGREILGNQVLGALLGQKLAVTEAGILEYVGVMKSVPFDPLSYKARPLNGIWATAPYLHNGSVPSLWEILQPQEKRTRKFSVGSRDFDPVHVGFQTRGRRGGFELDTTLPGNANAGHNYGTSLPEERKWALIEYLKSL